jgi:hypothetical protein
VRLRLADFRECSRAAAPLLTRQGQEKRGTALGHVLRDQDMLDAVATAIERDRNGK